MAEHDEQVEKVARALRAVHAELLGYTVPFGSLRKNAKDAYFVMARAAIAAMGEGWRDVASVMQHIYDSEINVSVSSFWDGGFEWKIGDDMNGFKAEGVAEDWDSTVYEMAEAISLRYPDSVFAAWWKTARETYWPRPLPPPPGAKP
jgi:hypothetical protein